MADVDLRVAQYIRETPELMLLAEQCVRDTSTRSAAARQFVIIMTDRYQQGKTPAGDRYSRYAFKLAIGPL